jgi:hypothetical protein
MRIVLPLLIFLAVVMGCAGEPEKARANRRNLVVEDVAIPAGGWHSWPFAVTEENARINGSYMTADGKETEIIFYVTDPASRDSLEKNNTGRYSYRSIDSRTRKHLNSILQPLDRGQYVILFHNESGADEHVVKVRLYLEY